MAARGGSRRVPLHRLADGTFAPRGRGQVLTPGTHVLVPHRTPGQPGVSGIYRGRRRVELTSGPDKGTMIHARQPPREQILRAPTGPDLSGAEREAVRRRGTASPGIDLGINDMHGALRDYAERYKKNKPQMQELKRLRTSLKDAKGRAQRTTLLRQIRSLENALTA